MCASTFRVVPGRKHVENLPFSSNTCMRWCSRSATKTRRSRLIPMLWTDQTHAVPGCSGPGLAPVPDEGSIPVELRDARRRSRRRRRRCRRAARQCRWGGEIVGASTRHPRTPALVFRSLPSLLKMLISCMSSSIQIFFSGHGDSGGFCGVRWGNFASPVPPPRAKDTVVLKPLFDGVAVSDPPRRRCDAGAFRALRIGVPA